MFLASILLSCALVSVCGQNEGAYYASWCGGELQYLDDSKCAKVFPSNTLRNLTCEASFVADNAQLPPGFEPDSPFAQISPNPLDQVITNGVDASVILTRRVGGALFNKYYSTPFRAYETWSSSKIFAMANAASTLRGRENGTCPGMDGATTGKAAPSIQLGDLATIVCSYDETAGYTSNSLARYVRSHAHALLKPGTRRCVALAGLASRCWASGPPASVATLSACVAAQLRGVSGSYFHDLGWRTTLHDLVQSAWLARNNSVSLGGNYGEPTPPGTTAVPAQMQPLRSRCKCGRGEPGPGAHVGEQ
jgi:hypothetical protein